VNGQPNTLTIGTQESYTPPSLTYLMVAQTPTYDKYWAFSREGGMNWLGNLPMVVFVMFVLGGLILVYVGDWVHGLLFFGIAAVGLLIYLWLERRDRAAVLKAATAKPIPNA
jgi:hypothetical protein